MYHSETSASKLLVSYQGTANDLTELITCPLLGGRTELCFNKLKQSFSIRWFFLSPSLVLNKLNIGNTLEWLTLSPHSERDLSWTSRVRDSGPFCEDFTGFLKHTYVKVDSKLCVCVLWWTRDMSRVFSLSFPYVIDSRLSHSYIGSIFRLTLVVEGTWKTQTKPKHTRWKHANSTLVWRKQPLHDYLRNGKSWKKQRKSSNQNKVFRSCTLCPIYINFCHSNISWCCQVGFTPIPQDQ